MNDMFKKETFEEPDYQVLAFDSFKLLEASGETPIDVFDEQE